MNVHELDEFKLEDTVKFHDRLNPRLWGRDEHLLPAVRDKLLEIAADFQEFLGVADLDVKDITVSGSNAAYSYSPNSDVDLHLVVKMPDDSSEVYQELFNAKKYQYNDQHNIKIGGADVELYVQPDNEPAVSQGVYSIANNKWISVPRRKKAQIDDTCVRHKVEDIGARIADAIASGDERRMTVLKDKIKRFRQSGLDQQGEFGCDNLAFKVLRNQGDIKRLYDAINAAKDERLSLAERNRPRQRVRYGFGEGHQGQPYSSEDGVAPSTCMFLNEEEDQEKIVHEFIEWVAGRLGITQMPEIFIHTDPKWSVEEHSFGRYEPDTHSLHVNMANRHLLDILRTTAHELVHCRQNQHHKLPPNAGQTGSRWENEAHAKAGVIMRDFADAHPELFDSPALQESIEEGWKNWVAGATMGAASLGAAAQPTQQSVQDQVSLTNKYYNVLVQRAKEDGRELDTRTLNVLKAKAQDAAAAKLQNQKAAGSTVSKDNLPSQGSERRVAKDIHQFESASGYIPTKKQAKDPRYAMALTVDIKPGQVGKEANKMGLETDNQGHPKMVYKSANQISESRNDGNEPRGPEFRPTMPRGTVRVDVSDMYDWYKLGKNIANLDRADPADFGKGPPSTIVSFGDEDTEHKYIKNLKKLGLTTTDIDPKDPNQPAGLPRQSTDPTYNVDEDAVLADKKLVDYQGLKISLRANNHTVAVDAFNAAGAKQVGQVVFNIDDNGQLEAADLEVAEKYRGQGVAKTMYDFVKAQGYTINRSWSQTAAGADFWDKNRGQERVWEEQDDLVESLRQEFEQLEEEYLGEIKMSPTNLRQEAAKTGARAGMEFEMIVPEAGSLDDGDQEPDWDMDESVRGFSSIRNFFHDGDYNGRRDVDRLEEQLINDYYDSDWLSEKKLEEWQEVAEEHIRDLVDRDYEDEFREQAREEVMDNTPEFGVNSDELSAAVEARYEELRDAKINEILADMGREYDEAYEEWEQNEWQDMANNSDWQDEWLEYQGITTMQDVQSNYDIQWPYWTTSEDEADIDAIADDFSNSIGKPVNASRSYHGARREAGHYVVEPDGSLEGNDAGDIGLEFVSPPMPIDEMMSDLNKVKAWADREGCYTNDSTGLHINISVPNYSLRELDYVKLALLLGDKYVLEQFGRVGNTYCKAAIGKVQDKVRQYPDASKELLDKMRNGMEQLASKAIHSGTTDKYTSINTKEGYIEFRSPGGDWLNANFDKIETTLLRFTVALSAAMDPEAYRQEYLKKLYKLLEPTAVETKNPDTIKYFADYVAGKTPRAALRSFVKQAQLQRRIAKDPTGGQPYWWRVSNPQYSHGEIEVVAKTKEEAIEKALLPDGYPSWARTRASIQAVPVRPYDASPLKATVGEPQAIGQRSGPAVGGRPSNPAGRWVITPEADRQSVVYRFNAAGFDDANVVRRQWAQEHPGVWIVQRDDNQTLGQPAGSSRNALSQTDIENRLGWPDQTGDANYEVVDRRTQQPVFKFVANTDQDALRKYSQYLDVMGMPEDTEDYGFREIVVPGSTVDLQRQRAAQAQQNQQTWNIVNRNTGEVAGTFTGTEHQAEDHALNTFGHRFIYDVVPAQQQPAAQQPAPQPLGAGRELLGWRVLLPTGQEVTQLRGIGNNQGDANRIAADWLRRNGYGVSGEGYEVVPLWGEA